MEYKRIAIDTSKHVFTIHGVDEQERPVLRRELKRGQIEVFFSKLAGTEVPAAAKAMFEHMGGHIMALENRTAILDAQLMALHKAHPVSRLLVGIPGVGSMIATTMALTVEPKNFASGRHFTAWLGLTPRENFTEG